MIDNGRARLSLLATVMLWSDVARAGVWGSDPTIGVSGAYGSNPALLNLPDTAESSAALLLDAPISYQGDALTLSFLPSFRLSDASYASLNSSYAHLSASGEFDTDRNTFKASAGANWDSSLLGDNLTNGTSPVPRDSLTGELSWTRHLTELLDAYLDANTQRVRYGEPPPGTAPLVNYEYTTVSPGLTWQLSERDRVTLSAIAGQYDTLDGTTRTRNIGGQLGYSRQLSEIWSLSLGGGYTRQQNRLSLLVPELGFIPGLGFVIIEVPVTIETEVGSPVYSARLTRTGPRLTLNLSGSRQETPNGFAFLSRQTIYVGQLSYALSPRWSVGLQEWWLSEHNPTVQSAYEDRIVNWVTVSSTYQLSEHYSLAIALSRVDQTYSTTDTHVGNNQVTLTLTYKFNHIGLQ
ncbi:MAG TPA: hypothetical protein VMT09_04895 [Steroidobacteraceae bacterium]|nr:hypothetical protein [Steroidobacteraceae bacterium]